MVCTNTGELITKKEDGRSSSSFEIVDAHHHFLDTNENSFQSFLARFVPHTAYLPDDYHRDVIKPLWQEKRIKIVGSVHVECMPDDGVSEVAWVESITDSQAPEAQLPTRDKPVALNFSENTVSIPNGPVVQAIVASVDLTQSDVQQTLHQLKQASPKVRGVRWILDCVGPYQPKTATHVATLRHDGEDYLDHDGNSKGKAFAFERGFAQLATHGMSFDLQCAPTQLPAAAALCARHPNVPVCVDHLGKPRALLGLDNCKIMSENSSTPDADELQRWREGMHALASLPQVYVKLSMLGYAVPGWIQTPERVALVKSLVREIVELFGPSRCMFAFNWWKDGPTSDADGMSTVGPNPVELVEYMSEWLSDYSEAERKDIFSGTARRFYRF